jgi:hypothetical protein
MMAIIRKEYNNSKRANDGNVVANEINQEVKHAFQLSNTIRQRLGIEWTNIEDSVEHLSPKWSEYGGVVDIGFLQEVT